MKTILFTYQSPVGTFWIRPEPAGRVQLGIDRHLLKSYDSPKAAARDVAAKNTGFAAWDTVEHAVVPRELHNWKRGPTLRSKKSAKPQRDSESEDE